MDGTTSDVTAATPNAIDPTMLSAAIRQTFEPRRQHTHRPQTPMSASSLATRKQTEPNASGAQTRRFVSCASNPRCIPMNVLTLKNSVPANWTSAASRSPRHGPGGAPRSWR